MKGWLILGMALLKNGTYKEKNRALIAETSFL